MANTDHIPDVRDGLTRAERVILYVLHETQKELNGRNVPLSMLYGRVSEYMDIDQRTFHRLVQRLVGTVPGR